MTTKEAQSEAPSVVTPQDIRDIFNRYGMNYSQIVGDENTVVSASLYTYNKAIDDIVAKINRLIKLAKKEERNRLTHQQIDSKIISSDDFKIEFELKFTDEPEHKYVFASSPKGFQVAVDGKNIVSKLSNNLSKGDGDEANGT